MRRVSVSKETKNGKQYSTAHTVVLYQNLAAVGSAVGLIDGLAVGPEGFAVGLLVAGDIVGL